MKLKTLLVFLFFFPFLAEGQVFDPALQRTHHHITAEIHKESAVINIRQTFTNTSSQDQFFSWHYPLPAPAEKISLFLEKQKQSFQTKKDEDLVHYIAEKVFSLRDYRFFRFYDSTHPHLLIAPDVLIPAGETKTLHLQFEQNIYTDEGLFFLEIFNQDDIPSQKTTLEINAFNDVVHHFWTNVSPSAQIQKWDDQITLVYTSFDPLFSENFQFFYSSLLRPILDYQDSYNHYQGTFIAPSQKKNFSEVTFLLDRSGSMLQEKWSRTQDWMHYFLENFPADISLRVGFFDEDLSWYQQDFEKNTFDFQKNFFPALSHILPVGKTDLKKALEEALKKGETPLPLEEKLLVVITDEVSFPDSDFVSPIPLIILSFGSDSVPQDLQDLAQRSQGIALNVFEFSSQLPKKEILEEQWDHLRRIFDLPPQKPLSYAGKTKNILTPQTPLIIEKKSISSKKEPSPFLFLARLWGQRHIAHLLKNAPSTKDLEDVLALSRLLGIETELFSASTTLAQLQENLTKSPPSDLFYEKLNSWEILSPLQTRWYQKTPVYWEESAVWRTVDFYDRNDPSTLISIAPYSEAQKELFLRFPSLVAPGFSIAEEVEFCAPFRCLSVRKGQREDPRPSDRAYFRDYDPSHWADKYLKKGVSLGLLEAELNGKLHPDRGIDRGTFTDMIFRYIFDQKPLAQAPQKFTDIEKDNAFFASTALLAYRNIISGYPDATFRPLQTLTRAEGVKILLASLGFYPSPEDMEKVALFPDSTGWEKPWVNEAVKRGIVRGKNETEFQPHQPLTRAEALKILLTAE